MRSLVIALLAALVALGALGGVASAQAPPIGDDLDAPVQLPADGLVGAFTDPLVRLRARPIGDGWVYPGEWTALHVRLDNLGEALTGELVVRTAGSGLEDHVHRRAVELAAGSRRELSLPFLAGRRSGELQVDFVAGRRSASTKVLQRTLGGDDVLIGVIGDDAAGLPSIHTAGGGAVPSFAARPVLDDDRGRQVRVGLLSPRGLPDRAHAYRAFSQLVWIDPDPSSLTPGQLQALRHHVADGGHLVVTTTERWRQLATSPLADLLPARPAGLVDGGGAAALATSLGFPSEAPAPMAELRRVDHPGRASVVLQAYQGAPIWVIGTYGLGTVAVVGVDPRVAPLAVPRLPAGLLWRALLHLPVDGASSWLDELHGESAERVRAHLSLDAPPVAETPLGRGLSSDDSSVLSEFIRDIPGVEPIPLTWLIGFSALYLILIGPVDYLVLRWLRREILTWITFPALIVVFSGLALVGITAFKGTQAVVTRVAFVDALPGTDLWRSDALYGLWATQRVSVTLRSGFEGGLATPITTEGYLVDPTHHGDAAGDGARFVVQTWALGHARTSGMAPRTGELRLSGSLDAPILHNELPFDLVAAGICNGADLIGTVGLPAGASAGLQRGQYDRLPNDLVFEIDALLTRACWYRAAGRAPLDAVSDGRKIVGVAIDPVDAFELRGLDPMPVNATVLRFPLSLADLQESSP